MMMTDGSMDDKDMRAEDDSSEKFPAFQGMDLDGNPVSNELFKENSVTVINFWFSACAPCIGELGELNALNEELKLKGGAVIDCCNDHRIAMMCAVAATRSTGGETVLQGAECVRKSYPDFWQVYRELGGDLDVLDLGE